MITFSLLLCPLVWVANTLVLVDETGVDKSSLACIHETYVNSAAAFCKDCANHYCTSCCLVWHKDPTRKNNFLEALIENQQQPGLEKITVQYSILH